MKKWKSSFDHIPSKGQTFTMISETVPDQSLTIREIMNRYAKGLPLGGHDLNEAIYDEESEGVNPNTLDLVDIQEIMEKKSSAEGTIKEKKERAAAQKKEKESLETKLDLPEGQ